MDLEMGFKVLQGNFSNQFSTSYSHFQTNMMFIANTHLETRNELKIFLQPFSSEVWLSMFFIVFGCVMTFVIVFLSLNTTFRRGLFGHIRGRFMFALFSIVFGLPTKYFQFNVFCTRILGSTLLAGFLVIRTVYFGKLYENYNAEEPIVFANIDQAMKEDYRPFVPASFVTFLEDIPEFQNKIILNNCSSADECFDNFLTSRTKYLAICSMEMFLFFRNNEPILWKFKLIKQEIFQMYLTLVFKLNSPIADIIGFEIMHMKACGFVEYSKRKYIKKRVDPKFSAPRRKHLIMSELSLELKVFITFSFVSICVFLLEIISLKTETLRKIIIHFNEM